MNLARSSRASGCRARSSKSVPTASTRRNVAANNSIDFGFRIVIAMYNVKQTKRVQMPSQTLNCRRFEARRLGANSGRQMGGTKFGLPGEAASAEYMGCHPFNLDNSSFDEPKDFE